MGLYRRIDDMCGVDEYSYMYHERDNKRKALIVKIIVTALFASIGLLIAFSIYLKIADMYASPLIYIGKIDMLNIQEDKTTLRVKSLIEPATGIVKWFGLADEVIWTGVKEPTEENKKMLMVSQFDETFTYDGSLQFKQGDIVKIYAKDLKIKEIKPASEKDIINGKTIVIRGKLKSYKEGNSGYTLTLSITDGQIKGVKKSYDLNFNKDGTKYRVGEEYEIVKDFDKGNWSITEIK